MPRMKGLPLSLFSVAVLILTNAIAPAQNPTTTTRLMFTGKLMGYFRVPDHQPGPGNKVDGDHPCTFVDKHGQPLKSSPDANIFLTKHTSPDQILLGMGDNFAPNYFSRAFANGDEDHPNEKAKDVYAWDGDDWVWYEDPHADTWEALNGHETIATDNVACFLSEAGYTAVVPGKHDFYYGPQRLRALARFMASIPDKDPHFRPVQMLASNLMIKTSWVKDHAPIPDSGKPKLPFTRKFVATNKNHSLEIEDFTDDGYAMPWMQFVHVKAQGWDETSLRRLKLFVCWAEWDPDRFLNHCHDPWLSQPEFHESATDSEQQVHLVYKLPLDKLVKNMPSSNLGGPNFALCALDPDAADGKSTSKSEKPYCLPFSMYQPFFQYPDWPCAGGKSAKGVRYSNPLPYVLTKGGQTVIFGVVDPKLREHIGGENFAWRDVRPRSPSDVSDPPLDKRYITQITVADPVQAIVQLYDYFKSEHPHFTGRRVLLAQMPADEAKQLAEHLPACVRFDVVIAEADDALATPNADFNFHPRGAPINVCNENCLEGIAIKTARYPNGSVQTPPAPIFVPPTHEISPLWPFRSVQVRSLMITTDATTFWNYSLSGEPTPVAVPDNKASSLQKLAKDFWDRVRTAACTGTTCSAGMWHDSLIQQLTLWSMYQHLGADVVLMQKRDFYTGGLDDYLAEHCTDQGGTATCDGKAAIEVDFQEVLNRILWKGDFVRLRLVQGSVLKTIMKQSTAFSKIEKAAYLPVEEAGRSLVTLGIVQDTAEGGDFLINQKPLDPNQLYAVATSDYIALGDTGYSDLATPPVGNALVPGQSNEELVTISGAVCLQLQTTGSCDNARDGKQYYDAIANQHPSDPRPGATNFHKLYAWSILQRNVGQEKLMLEGAEERLAKQTNWDISLDQFSLGFTALTHNGSEQTLSQRFAGVQNGNVNAKHSHEFDWDANSSLKWFHPKYDWFITETLQYYSNFTAQVTGPAAETQSKNAFMLDGGSYLHLHEASSKKLPQFSAVLAGHFETQVGNPLTNLSIIVPPATSPAGLKFKQGRTRTVLGRVGLRFQDRKSYIEGGLEGGEVLNAIQAFVFSTSGAVPLACALQASQTLTTCVNTFNRNNPATPVTPQSSVSVLRAPQPRYGAYSKIGLTVPLHPIVSYSFQDTGDFFFNSSGDNSADTRFRHTLVNALKFRVFPSLSFEPTYTIFFYENKVDYHTLFQQQYSVKINLSFDWTNWHEFWRQAQFKKPGS